ncbi:MAG: hypothetical protein AVDCRST_MAG68-335 [uncultured Gemmatimonadetes bacterium]|uniref:DUF1905 domain-containing protein n=1 Tax=uncultured Gemmatimonadota bacterium TaxID=203437 RepID=A0A6J4K9W2_9BACT|nr:MAG: hypothetical protein AVDCRST_MAG68-335 [uncultured Gemmatimonadota bacterium]
MYEVSFSSALFTYPGKGGWTFATVPERFAPSTVGAWGRVSVTATVNGATWETSVWRERSGRTLLPVPRKIRGSLGNGDEVDVVLRFKHL